jgi:hypothetical protein
MNEKEKNLLLAFAWMVIQTICDPKQENRYNFELKRGFDSPCFINIVKTLRWTHDQKT